MRPPAPSRSALRRATSGAAPDTSVATIDAPRSSAIAMARHPLPVPTSATSGAAMPRSVAEADSMINSVSGRGMRTAGVTSNDRPQNS